jgi:hypothetical protein
MAGYCERRSTHTRKGESSQALCDTSYATGLAQLVRGSSRRITTMLAGVTARSANITVINRRRNVFDLCSEYPAEKNEML